MSDSDDTDDSFSEESRSLNDYNIATPVPGKTSSFLCLALCAIWSLYSCNHHISLYPFGSCIVILGYAIIGIARRQSIKCEEMYEISRVLAAIVPMAAINAHMLRCNADAAKSCSDLTVLLSLAALPCILKMANPQRTESIVEIVEWCNISTLGVKAIDRDFHLGLALSFWQGFYTLLTNNSHKWLLTDPEIPFNLGLSGSCILFCRLHSC